MSVHKHGTTGPGCAGTCCLKATDLGVSFGGEEVLRDVSFHLHCGEIVALIGPNGAGKSSLFRTILGQVPHTGTIEFQRAGGDKTRPLIGYVPQSPSFDRGDPVSVFDFFSAAISRYPVFLPSPRSLRARVGACLARVHGESLLDRRMGALSGGELQRVLLALALEPLPHILVLDEPLSGVDIDGEKQLLDMLDEIRTRYDLSILLSTHDFATLGQFADKVEDDKPIFSIENLDQLELEVKISEFSIGKVKEGQKALIGADILNGKKEEGEVIKISPTGEEKGGGSTERVIPTIIRVNTPDTKLMAGITARAELLVRESKDAFAVPVSAVFDSGEVSYIEIVENGKICWIPVTIGADGETKVEVLPADGTVLQEGMAVVTSPDPGLTEGMVSGSQEGR